jgi:hypothetical protein
MVWYKDLALIKRDLKLVYVLLVWAAFAFTFFYVFSGGVRSNRVEHVPPTTQAKKSKAQTDDEIYTGSIILVPPTGTKCWQMMIDNRDGYMWETGYVDCYVAVAELAEAKRKGSINANRIKTISNAFRGGPK